MTTWKKSSTRPRQRKGRGKRWPHLTAQQGKIQLARRTMPRCRGGPLHGIVCKACPQTCDPPLRHPGNPHAGHPGATSAISTLGAPCPESPFQFEDLAGIYTAQGSSRLFAVCTQYEPIPGYRVLPGDLPVRHCTGIGRKPCASCCTCLKTEYGAEPAFTDAAHRGVGHPTVELRGAGLSGDIAPFAP